MLVKHLRRGYANRMRTDMAKVEDAVLALLALFVFDERVAWKSYDWAVTNSLFEKGFIGDPRNKNKSVVLTDEGLRRGKELAEGLFSA